MSIRQRYFLATPRKSMPDVTRQQNFCYVRLLELYFFISILLLVVYNFLFLRIYKVSLPPPLIFRKRLKIMKNHEICVWGAILLKGLMEVFLRKCPKFKNFKWDPSYCSISLKGIKKENFWCKGDWYVNLFGSYLGLKFEKANF